MTESLNLSHPSRPSRANWRTQAAVLGVALIGGLAGSQMVTPAMSQLGLPAGQAAVDGQAVQGQRAAADLAVAFRQVIRSVQPAVVAIRSEAKAEDVAAAPRRPLDPRQRQLQEMLRRQFGGNVPFDLEQMQQSPRRKSPSSGVGSGFIINGRDGFVVTNNHVIDGADEVFVTLDDGRVLQAKEWRTDPKSDVAVLFLDIDDFDRPLPEVPLGESEQVELGDWVLAIGNPFAIGTTSTQGIISGRNRTANLNDRENYLQTDAAINPGNSGGPLVNLRGEVIGVNTAIHSRSGGYDGIGFAIPSSTVRWVTDSLIDSGSVERSYIGIALTTLDPDVRLALELPAGVGVAVDQVGDGPGKAAGLEAGDVIVSFDGRPVRTLNGLQAMVERKAPGSTAPVEISRDGARQTVTVTFEAMPQDFALRGDDTASGDSFDTLGLSVVELTPSLAEQFGVDRGQTGVVVTEIEAGSPAERKGMQVGDVIYRVGTRNVRTLGDFEDAVDNLDVSEGVLLRVRRGESVKLYFLKSDD